MLKDALKKDPGNIPIQLKLLSIYANRKDVNAFSSIARKVKDSGDAAAWEQVAALGRSIDASNPMYGGGGAAPAAPAAAAAAAPAVDLDLGAGMPMDFDITGGGAAAPAMPDFDVTSKTPVAAPTIMDFDVTTSHPMPAFSTEAAPAAAVPAMDFDVTGEHAITPEPPTFDVTGGHPELPAMAGLDFDVTGSHPHVVAEAAAQAAPAAPSFEGLTMDFDLGAPPPAPAAPEPAPSLDLGALTFDITAPPAALQKAPEAPSGALDLGEISLNLDESVITQVSPMAEAGKDDQWHEVATKLDLAKAYYEMGDGEGAREILSEVLRDGDEQQRASAQALMQQL